MARIGVQDFAAQLLSSSEPAFEVLVSSFVEDSTDIDGIAGYCIDLTALFILAAAAAGAGLIAARPHALSKPGLMLCLNKW